MTWEARPHATPIDCHAARAGLWPPERPRLHGDEEAAAREHVRGCAECTRYFLQDRRLLEALDEVGRRAAPMRVRERVVDALARSRLERRRPPGAESPGGARPARNRALAGLVAVALLGTGGAVVWRSAGIGEPTGTLVGQALAEDFIRRAVAEDRLASDDPLAVTRFLTRELGLRADLLPVEGFALVGVEICLVDGRRGAMVVYRMGPRTLSHYLIPRADGPGRPPSIELPATGDGERGIPVVTWASSNVEHALVGETEPAELLELARRYVAPGLPASGGGRPSGSEPGAK